MPTSSKQSEASVTEFAMISFKKTSRLSWSAVKWMMIFQLSLLLTAGSLLRIFIYRTLDSSDNTAREFLGALDSFLVSTFWSLVLVSFLFALLFAQRFFTPLGILITKAKSILKNKEPQKDIGVIKENRGEWYQLDLSLNKISRELKQKKAEVVKERDELEAVITAAHDAIMAVDHQLNIRYYNAPMALLLDQRDEGFWGKSLKEVVRNKDVVDAFTRVLSGQPSQFIQINQATSQDGSVGYYQVAISPFFDEKKTRTRGAVAIFHDITEHKRVDKIRVDFVANASHELKTPLTSIQGYLSFIKESCRSNETLHEAFQVVETNLDRLNRLSGDLLELSKIDSLELASKESLSTREMTEDIISELQPRMKAKGHHLECQYQVEQVMASKDLLEHVMLNLIENAIKYCPPQSKIIIKWGSANHYTWLSVKDSGPGIESYHQRRIFERFYRVREGVASVSGTGLGLSIVRNAMQRQGGHIDLKSAPGLGSEFICYFPE
jgi:PAS domain S-box-containing protein